MYFTHGLIYGKTTLLDVCKHFYLYKSPLIWKIKDAPQNSEKHLWEIGFRVPEQGSSQPPVLHCAGPLPSAPLCLSRLLLVLRLCPGLSPL